MNIQEYIAVLKREKEFFFALVIGLWLLSFLWFLLQPISYSGALLVNIGRTVNEPSTEYSYDNFYRLQADERFGDTLVRWLSNPRIVSDILMAAGSSPEQYSEKSLQSLFQAKRLSSQVVEVRYTGQSREGVKKYAEALIEVTQEYTESLNSTQVNWFRVSGSEPIIRDARLPAFPFLALSLFASIFVAFWAVFLKEFFTNPPQKRK